MSGPDALRGQSAQAPCDRLPDADWNRESDCCLWTREPPLGGEQAHDLADEERVSFGLLVDRPDELLCRGDARRELDVACDVTPAQATEHKQPRRRRARERRKSRSERMVGVDLDVAVGADEEDAARR